MYSSTCIIFDTYAKYLTSECTEKLIHEFITSRLDYCNSLLYGVPDHHVQNLQRVMNASARLIFCAPKHCHITPLLQQLHWLPIRQRIEFKILLITYKVLQGSAPKYLIDLISVLPPSRFDLRRNNKGILLSKTVVLQKSPWGIDPSWRQCHGFGIVFPWTLDLLAPQVILQFFRKLLFNCK